MASEVRYVNSQKVHNPTFTRVVSSQVTAFPDRENQQLEETGVSDIRLAASSVQSAPLKEALEDDVSRLEIALEGQSDPSSDGCSQQIGHTSVYTEPLAALVLSLSMTEALPDLASVAEPPLNGQTTVSLSGGHGRDSVPVDEAVQNIAAVDHQSASKPKDPPLSDSDDVQFILSVTRKKRRKRPRQDPLLGDLAQGGNADEMRNIPGKTNNNVNSSPNNGQQTGNVLSPTFISTGNYPHPQISTQHAQDGSPSPSAASNSALARFPSSIAPKARKPISRKRKRGQAAVSNVTTQLVGNEIVNSTLISPQTPIWHQHLQFSQNTFPTRPLSHVQHMSGINPTITGQPTSGFGDCPLPHGFGPQFQQPRANGVQNPLCSQVGPAASTNQTSVAMSASFRRRPSLYGVPQWQSSPSSTGLVQQAMSASSASSVYQNPYAPRDDNLQGVSPMLTHIAGPGNVRSSASTPIGLVPPQTAISQPQIVQMPTIHPDGPSKSTHPPNMLVDIAQTCQDNFPFALIAKRHDQPIQKVFNAFSAIIQLPLLRSAIDARRPGKLGSLRMKEFRAMKKAVRELQKGEQRGRKVGRKVEENGTVNP
jgi:hypothetical protein